MEHNLIIYRKLTLGRIGFKGVLNGKRIHSQYKDVDFWGIEDANGKIYRVNKRANLVDQVISQGKIFYYAGMEVEIKKEGDIADKISETISIKADMGVKFSDIFWISDGADGDMLGASKENLSSVLSDSPGVVAKMQNIDETNADNWIDAFTGIAFLIHKYNQAHQ